VDLQLTGKTAYVTGTATGIGREIIRLLATEGARIFAVDRAIDVLNDLIVSDRLDAVKTHYADLSIRDECNGAADAAVHHFGSAPDILINNVGIGRMLPFESLTDEDFHHTFELNFFAMARTCMRLIPLMKRGDGGSVVNVTSDLAGQPETVFVDYAASKAAMASLSKTLARTYAPTVRVNDVAPGPIWTPLWSRPGGYLETVEENYGLEGDAAIEALIHDREIPMGRLGNPEDIARAVVFLASPLSAYTTGASLGVDGGTVRSAF
jgi:NAD(P)-dependent dehydrogenase (short-subunit alcohol dehydrogenase family)